MTSIAEGTTSTPQSSRQTKSQASSQVPALLWLSGESGRGCLEAQLQLQGLSLLVWCSRIQGTGHDVGGCQMESCPIAIDLLALTSVVLVG